MTAVLAAAARAALYGILGAALVLVCVAAMLWAKFGPQGFWTLAWLGVVAVVVAGCGVAWEWLGKRRRKQAQRCAEVTHQCPPDGGGLMPCCGRTPFEVPRTDRMTLDSALVTCRQRRGGRR